MALSLASSSAASRAAGRPKAAARSSLSRPSKLVVRASADKQAAREQMRATGFVQEDNAGRSNIFPVRQQAYIKSTSPVQGLGGAQGIIVLGVLLAGLAAFTLLQAKAPGPETLASVSDQFGGESLTSIAARIKASL